MKDVTIVIPTFRREDAEKTVECLKGQTVSVDILVVDDPELNVAEARNKGIEEACSEIVGFTDDDCYPHEDWVEKALRNFDSDEVAGVEGKTYGGLERIYPWGYMGCNIFYRKHVLDEIGGFDPKLAGWKEDTELAWRVLKKGYNIVYEEEARVYHPFKPRSRSIPKNEKILFFRFPWKYLKDEIVKRSLYILAGFSNEEYPLVSLFNWSLKVMENEKSKWWGILFDG